MASNNVIKVGRGGAGNIQALKAIQQGSEDIEAQDRQPVVDAILQNKAPAPYARSGRGGAGNLFSPADAPKPNEPEPADVLNTSMRASAPGRGGIGNFEAAKIAIQTDLKRPSAGVGSQQAYAADEEADEQVKSPERAYLGEGRQAEHGES